MEIRLEKEHVTVCHSVSMSNHHKGQRLQDLDHVAPEEAAWRGDQDLESLERWSSQGRG